MTLLPPRSLQQRRFRQLLRLQLPRCFDACAQAWPPLTVAGDFVISGELQASGATTIDRPDGSKQVVMGKWALYYYAGDGAPGEANGQGSKDKW